MFDFFGFFLWRFTIRKTILKMNTLKKNISYKLFDKKMFSVWTGDIMWETSAKHGKTS